MAEKLAFLVPSEKAGKVIGKDGAVFKMLRQTGCEMHVAQESDAEGLRRADMRALSPEHLASGLQLVTGRVLYKQDRGTMTLIVLRVQADVFDGEQGEEKLQNIKKMTGVVVEIDREGEAGEEECRVTLEGNPTFMGHAFRLFLRECLERGIGGTAMAGGGAAPNGAPSIMEDREVEVRFALPERHADAVRGEGDEVLRRITEESGCRDLTVTFDLDDDSLALAVVQGTFKSCVAAQRALHEQLARAAQEASEDPPDRVTLTYLVPRERAGAVVGKAGQGLRQIREATRVRVDLAQEEVEGHRLCALTGPLQGTLCAEEFVHNLVIGKGIAVMGIVRFEDLVYSVPQQPPAGETSAPGKRPLEGDAEEPAAKRTRCPPPGEKATTKMLVPGRSVGAVIGKNGSGLTKIREAHRVKVEVLKQEEVPHWPMDRMVVIRGRLQGRIKAMNDVLTASADSDQAFLKLLVTPNLAGKVIGNKGAKLKSIRDQTDVQIKVERDEVQGERLVWCQGGVKSLQKAGAEIMAVIDVPEDDERGRGGRHGARAGDRHGDRQREEEWRRWEAEQRHRDPYAGYYGYGPPPGYPGHPGHGDPGAAAALGYGPYADHRPPPPGPPPPAVPPGFERAPGPPPPPPGYGAPPPPGYYPPPPVAPGYDYYHQDYRGAPAAAPPRGSAGQPPPGPPPPPDDRGPPPVHHDPYLSEYRELPAGPPPPRGGAGPPGHHGPPGEHGLPAPAPPSATPAATPAPAHSHGHRPAPAPSSVPAPSSAPSYGAAHGHAQPSAPPRPGERDAGVGGGQRPAPFNAFAPAAATGGASQGRPPLEPLYPPGQGPPPTRH